MTTDRERLATILRHLQDFELRLPLPHERPALEVAKQALREEAKRLAHRFSALDYLRPERHAPASNAVAEACVVSHWGTCRSAR
jgi:hypothetical protein